MWHVVEMQAKPNSNLMSQLKELTRNLGIMDGNGENSIVQSQGEDTDKDELVQPRISRLVNRTMRDLKQAWSCLKVKGR
jgi:hypothetical protein